MLYAYENKTKYMFTRNSPNLKQDLNVDGHACEKVRSCDEEKIITVKKQR